MKLPVKLAVTIGYNAWQRYKGPGSGKGPRRMVDLQLVAVRGARQALADELGVTIDDVKIEWSK